MFQHFIITRFNLKAVDPNLVMDEEASNRWMEERVRIFEDFCYASVKGQKNQLFTWLVFFESTTQSKHVKTITRLAEQYSNFIPVYISGVEQFLPSLKLAIAERAPSEYIITSRLDNDDCLHESYVDAVQNQFYSQDFIIINFIHGITLDISSYENFYNISHENNSSQSVKCGYRINASNPFISLIERNNNIETVYSRSHGQWSKIKLIKDVDNHEPLWLSLIHGKNIFNEYIGFGLIEKPLLERFNIDPMILERFYDEMVVNKKLSSLKNKFSAYLHFFLKKTRNRLRGKLSLIPER